MEPTDRIVLDQTQRSRRPRPDVRPVVARERHADEPDRDRPRFRCKAHEESAICPSVSPSICRSTHPSFSLSASSQCSRSLIPSH